MKNSTMARSYIRQALEHGNYPYVVRQSQEAVELLLKAALRLVGVEPRSGVTRARC